MSPEVNSSIFRFSMKLIQLIEIATGLKTKLIVGSRLMICITKGIELTNLMSY